MGVARLCRHAGNVNNTDIEAKASHNYNVSLDVSAIDCIKLPYGHIQVAIQPPMSYIYLTSLVGDQLQAVPQHIRK
jgi:hypothetical protein